MMDRDKRCMQGEVKVLSGVAIAVKLLMIVGLFVLLLIPCALAIGISPGRTTIDVSSNLQKLSSEVKFSVANSEKKDMDVAFTVEGALKDYVTLGEDVVHFASSDSSKEFVYIISLQGNEQLEPGLHKADIVAIELPKDRDDLGTVVRASVSVVTQLYLYVLYPGKHLEAELDVMEKEDGKVYFYTSLIGRGNESIGKVSANIRIHDSSGSEIKVLGTNDAALTPSERKELVAVWENPDAGKYMAVAEINFDGETKTIKKEFSVGNELSILGISVKDFRLGDIAKIKILVQNKLSEVVKNTFVNLKIYDSKMEQIEDLKSELYDLSSGKNTEMVIYWDTENTIEGLYDSDLRINYDDDEFIEKSFKIDVKESSMSFTGVGFAIASVESGKKTSFVIILFFVIGILILVNLIWLVWWIRSKRKSRK